MDPGRAVRQHCSMIVVFGSINLDLIFALPSIPRAGETVLGADTRIEPGGKGANQAVAAARDGARVVIAGAVGRDALAPGALRLLREVGVDLSRVAETDAATGCAAITVDPAGNNAIAVGSGANLLARADQVEDALLSPATTLLLQMEVPAAETAALIRRARGRGARIVLNLAPAGSLPEDALRALDVLLVNETEAAWLCHQLGCGSTAADLHAALGGVDAVRTLGGDGIEAATKAGMWRIPARPIRAVDTTAAGDCFAGVLAAALDRGTDMAAALLRANVAAALCCTRAGSQGSLPTAAETDAALGK
ncbi:MAG TPA: ribokinase [Acetobacteraceae bacterium]|nr:ribokinase [Acetobacteraceae bacterium]